ncbi:MAG: RNA polymerase sigma factor (sigma-70 family) [Myxococcota bacterium]|jgi:RNA polymerase sigma factor (sigma-70 family)
MSTLRALFAWAGPTAEASPTTKAVMSNTPEQLLVETLRGDTIARERLVICLLPVIHARVARAVLRHGPASVRHNLRMEVEDLVQEISLSLFEDDCRILRTWSSRHGVPLVGFIGVVARRRTISLLRQRWKTETLLSGEILAQTASEMGLEDALIRRDLLMRCFAAVGSVQNPLGTEMMRLLFLEGLPVSAIEEQTGRSAAAIYQWRRRLVEALRQELMRLRAEAG